jgi:hypothetical protein
MSQNEGGKCEYHGRSAELIGFGARLVDICAGFADLKLCLSLQNCGV